MNYFAKLPRRARTIFTVLVTVLVLSQVYHSFILRQIGYDWIPDPFVVMDERTWVWQGLGIRANGIPAGWSDLPIYRQGQEGNIDGFNLSVDGVKPNLSNFAGFPKPVRAVLQFDYGKGIRQTQFVQPLIEQPPVGSIILGLLVPPSVDTFTKLFPADFRKMSLYLAVATQVLIFIVGWQLFKNVVIGALASILYGSVPTFMLMSRYGLLENVLTPIILVMISLLLLVTHLKNQIFLKTLLVCAGVLAGLAGLIKISGWVALVIGVGMLFQLGYRFKRTLFFAVPAILVGSLFFAWGLYLAPRLFVDMLLGGVERGFVGSLNLLTSALKVNIINFPFDGWWLGGFLSLLLIDWKDRNRLLAVPVIAILFSALVPSGLNNPWYYIPLIPFMCLGIALFFWQVAENPSIFRLLTFFLVYLSSSFYWGYIVFKTPADAPHYQHQPFGLYKLLFLAFLLLGLIWHKFPEKLIRFKAVWVVFILLVVYQMVSWNYRSFLYILSQWGRIPPVFILGVE